MRILIDALTFESRDGGFATALKGLVSTVTKIGGFDFVVACHPSSRATFESLGAQVHAVSFPIRLRWHLAPFLIEKIAKRVGADAIHHEISAPGIFGRFPFSVTVHDLHFSAKNHVRRTGLTGLAMEQYWRSYFVPSLKAAKRIKSVSNTTRDDIVRRLPHISSERIECIYPKIEPLYATKTERNFSTGTPLRLLFLGSIVPRKNLSFLLQALKHVRRPWELDVVGNIWWGAAGLSEWKSDDRVRLHGYLESTELARISASAHLFVSPATYEGFGLPSAEAMSAGLPVFASDISAHREFIPREWLFCLEDPLELTRMIEKLDYEGYELLLGRLPHIAEQFSEEVHVSKHASFFRDAFAAGVKH